MMSGNAWFRRTTLPALAALTLLAPTTALACGPYIPLDGEASLNRERGLVIWDGETEQVLMELAVTSAASEAAWIFPSPAPATVELGDSAVLDELDTLTRPQIVVDHRPGWPSFTLGAGAPEGVGGVAVLSRQTLGPFEVATLAAEETGALQGWLADNGYGFPDGLDEILRPYVEQGWYYVAVKLTPAAEGAALDGQLDPLWITFAAAEPVYTMRAAAMAPDAFPLTLYVFAEHRVEKSAAFGRSEVAYADWVDPAELPASWTLGARLPGRLFLTKFREDVNPALVNDDYAFAFAAQDEVYHETITQVVYDDYTWLAVVGLSCCGLLLFGVIGGIVVAGRKRKKPG